jgi:hypothetical protein
MEIEEHCNRKATLLNRLEDLGNSNGIIENHSSSEARLHWDTLIQEAVISYLFFRFQ